MTQITPELLNAVMAKQGAPNTTDNLNRIAEFAAVNPGVLEQYIGQGRDASTVGNSITNSIAATDGVAPRGLADPNGYVSTVDEKTGMSNIGPRLTQAPNIADPSRGPARAAPSNAGKRGVAPPTEPPPGSIPTPGTPTAAAPGDDSLGVPWWLAPFAARKLAPKPQGPGPTPAPVPEPRGGLPAQQGPRAVATPDPNAEYAGRTRPGGGVTDVNDLNAQSVGQEVRAGLPPPAQPQFRDTVDADLERMRAGQPRQLPGSNAPMYPSGAPPISKDQIFDATKGPVQEQIDAENARILQEQIRAQNAANPPAQQPPTRTPRGGKPAVPRIRG